MRKQIPQKVNNGFHIQGGDVNIDVIISSIEGKGTKDAYFDFKVKGVEGMNRVGLVTGDSLMLTDEINLTHSNFNGRNDTPVYLEFKTKRRYSVRHQIYP